MTDQYLKSNRNYNDAFQGGGEKRGQKEGGEIRGKTKHGNM